MRVLAPWNAASTLIAQSARCSLAVDRPSREPLLGKYSTAVVCYYCTLLLGKFLTAVVCYYYTLLLGNFLRAHSNDAPFVPLLTWIRPPHSVMVNIFV